MIRFLKHEEIDFTKWDAAIDAGTNGMVYAKSWFLDIVSPGWQALTDEAYTTIFPLTCRKKYGLSYLFQPFFTQQLGIFSKDHLSQENVDQYLSAIPDRFRIVEIQLNQTNRCSKGNFRISERLTHHLDLSLPYESIEKKYAENLKRNLKRARQNNLSIVNDFKTKALVELFRSNRGREISILKDKDYDALIQLVEEGERRKLITKAGVLLEGALEAGAIFIRSNREYIFLFSATGEKAKDTGAMSFIIDHFIRAHAQEKMALDFEGSMDPGLARFYKSFGSNEVVYLQVRRNNLPLLLRWLK